MAPAPLAPLTPLAPLAPRGRLRLDLPFDEALQELARRPVSALDSPSLSAPEETDNNISVGIGGWPEFSLSRSRSKSQGDPLRLAPQPQPKRARSHGSLAPLQGVTGDRRLNSKQQQQQQQQQQPEHEALLTKHSANRGPLLQSRAALSPLLPKTPEPVRSSSKRMKPAVSNEAPVPSKEVPSSKPPSSTAKAGFGQQQPQQRPVLSPKEVKIADEPAERIEVKVEEFVVQRPEKEDEEEKIVSEWTISKEIGLPLDIARQAMVMFRKYADFPIPGSVANAYLNISDFGQVLCDVCSVNSVDELPLTFVEKAFQAADRDGGGTVDVEEFAAWYAAFSFSEEVVVSRDGRTSRKIARRLGLALMDIERYKTAFDRFDLDGSGVIEANEFEALLGLLMKVPQGMKLPASRVKSLWRLVDRNGNGEIDFEEFCEFYMKFFDNPQEGTAFSFSDFYRNVRKVSVARSPQD